MQEMQKLMIFSLLLHRTNVAIFLYFVFTVKHQIRLHRNVTICQHLKWGHIVVYALIVISTLISVIHRNGSSVPIWYQLVIMHYLH